MGQGGTDICTDGQIPPVFYRTLSPSGPLPKKPTIHRPGIITLKEEIETLCLCEMCDMLWFLHVCNSLPDVKMGCGDGTEDGQLPNVKFVNRENSFNLTHKPGLQVVNGYVARHRLEQY